MTNEEISKNIFITTLPMVWQHLIFHSFIHFFLVSTCLSSESIDRDKTAILFTLIAASSSFEKENFHWEDTQRILVTPRICRSINEKFYNRFVNRSRSIDINRGLVVRWRFIQVGRLSLMRSNHDACARLSERASRGGRTHWWSMGSSS